MFVELIYIREYIFNFNKYHILREKKCYTIKI